MTDLPDFEDNKAVELWLTTQPWQVGTALAARAALRVFPTLLRDGAFNVSNERHTSFTLTSFRATLTSAAAATCPGNEPIETATLHSAALSTTHSTRSVTRSAALSALSAAISTASSAALSVSSAAHSLALSAAHSENSTDASLAANDPAAPFNTPLWPEGSEAHAHYLTLWTDFRDAEQGNLVWDFWLRWYQGIWDGEPLDWALARNVALIPDEVWEAENAPEAVAAEIRKIEKAHVSTSQPTRPEPVTTDNVVSLFTHAPIVEASMGSLAASITAHADVFRRMECPNEQIPFVETLERLPQIADKIAKTVVQAPPSETAQTALALEVGRLRAEVERLRSDLKTALAEIEELKEKPWYRSASVLAFGAIATVVTGLYTLSGDDKRLQERANNLAKDFAFLSEQLWPTPEDRIEPPLRFEPPE